MNSGLLISGLLDLGWVCAAIMGAAMLALAYRVGSDYAFTAPGISRMGPRVGERLRPSEIVVGGKRYLWGQLLSSEQPNLVIFLNLLGDPSTELVQHLRKFASHAEGTFRLLVFYVGPYEQVASLSTVSSHLKLIPLEETVPQLSKKLGIRVMPFGMVIGRSARVLSKGLVNHRQHLCHLFALAKDHLSPQEWTATETLCRYQ